MTNPIISEFKSISKTDSKILLKFPKKTSFPEIGIFIKQVLLYKGMKGQI